MREDEGSGSGVESTAKAYSGRQVDDAMAQPGQTEQDGYSSFAFGGGVTLPPNQKNPQEWADRAVKRQKPLKAGKKGRWELSRCKGCSKGQVWRHSPGPEQWAWTSKGSQLASGLLGRKWESYLAGP